MGTRASPLARWQALQVVEALRRAGVAAELVPVRTRGDRMRGRPLAEVGGEGLFVGALETALRAGRIDCAVHSLKDVPTKLGEGLALVAMGRREDPRDALVAAPGTTLAGLAAGAQVATGSARRAAFLKHWRPDVEVVPVRGNVGTRLRRWREAGWAGLVLAAAGVKRLGLEEWVAEYLDPLRMVPAPGQGIVAVEAPSGDLRWRRWLSGFHDPVSAVCGEAERRVLAAIGGGCLIPLGVFAAVEGERLRMVAQLASPDGDRLLRAEREGPVGAATAVADDLARALWQQGAEGMLAEVRRR